MTILEELIKLDKWVTDIVNHDNQEFNQSLMFSISIEVRKSGSSAVFLCAMVDEDTPVGGMSYITKESAEILTSLLGSCCVEYTPFLFTGVFRRLIIDEYISE